MKCININSKEFKELVEGSKMSSIKTEFYAKEWQKRNNSDELPSIEQLLDLDKQVYKLLDPKKTDFLYVLDKNKKLSKNEEDWNQITRDLMFNNNLNGFITSKDIVTNLLDNIDNLKPEFKKLLRIFKSRSNSKIKFQNLQKDGTLMAFKVNKNEILIDKSKFEKYPPDAIISAFIHELVHETSIQSLLDPITIDQKMYNQEIDEAFKMYKTKFEELEDKDDILKANTYGFTNKLEFVAELMSNPTFQAVLDKIDNKDKSIWFKIVESIRRLLGLYNNPTYNDLINSTIKVISYSNFNGGLRMRELNKDVSDLEIKLDTVNDQYNHSMDKIKQSLTQNINTFKTISKFKRYKDEKAADKLDKYVKGLVEIQGLIEQYRETNAAQALTTFTKSMITSLDVIKRRLDGIDYDNIEESLETYRIYSNYISTYSVSEDVAELIASLRENKENDLLTEEELNDIEETIKSSNAEFQNLSTRINVVRNKLVSSILSNPKYHPKVIYKYTKRFEKEHKQLGIVEDKDTWVSKQLESSKEDIENDIKDEVNKIINNPSYDIYSSDVLLSSANNLSPVLIQVMNQMLFDVQNERIETERKKDIEFKKLYDKLVADKSSNNITKLYENIIEFDKDGKPYIKSEYSIKLQDEVISKIRNLKSELYTKQSELREEIVKVKKDKGIDSKEFSKLEKELSTLKNNYNSKIKKLEESNFIYENKQIVKPKDKWLNNNNSLSSVEKEVLEFFQNETEANNKYFNKSESLVKYAHKGVRFYELPKVTKTNSERLWNEGIKSNTVGKAKDTWKELTTVRPDDIGYTTQFTDLAGNKINKLRVHYRDTFNNFDNKDQSLDLMTIMRLDFKNANIHKIRRKSELELNMLVDVAKHKKYYETKGTQSVKSSSTGLLNVKSGLESNTYKMMKNMLEIRFYDILNKNNTKLGAIDLNKTTQYLNNATGFLTLSLNIASGTANVINASAQLFLESFIKGKHIKASSIKKANGIYQKHLVETMKDTTRPIPTSYVNQIIELFNSKGLFNLSDGDFLKTDMVKQGFSPNSLRIFQESGEHWLHSVTVMSTLDSVMVRDENHNYLNKDGKIVKDATKAASVLDMLIQDSNTGLVDMHPKVAYTSHSKVTKWKEGGKSKIDTLVQKKLYDTVGNYTEIDQPDIKRHWWGKLLMLFRNYFMSMGQARLRGIEFAFTKKEDLKDHQKRFSYALQEYEEGTYTTLARYVLTALKDKKLSLLTTNWDNLTDYEKHNIKRSVTEITMTLVMLPLIAAFVSGIADEDDDEMLFFLAYQIKRLDTELSSYRNPSEMFKMLKSPVPSLRIIESGIGAVTQLATPWTLLDEYETGENTGKNKFITRTLKSTPVVKEFQRSYESLYNFQNR